MTEPVIQREILKGGSKARQVLTLNGAEAQLTYSVTSPTMVIADHTEVSEALRGTGAGLLLVKRLVADARAESFKILPLCPFTNAMRRKHPEWADAFDV